MELEKGEGDNIVIVVIVKMNGYLHNEESRELSSDLSPEHDDKLLKNRWIIVIIFMKV